MELQGGDMADEGLVHRRPKRSLCTVWFKAWGLGFRDSSTAEDTMIEQTCTWTGSSECLRRVKRLRTDA